MGKYPIDDRNFQFGEIYLVKDKEVVFPEAKYTKRTFHDKRMVCVIHHCESNSNKLVWTLNAAPLSTQVHMKRDTDLEIEPRDGNYINQKSLIRLSSAQPFLKIDLEGPVGRLTEDQMLELAALQLRLAGIDPDEE